MKDKVKSSFKQLRSERKYPFEQKGKNTEKSNKFDSKSARKIVEESLNFNYSTRSKSSAGTRSRKAAYPRCCGCPCGKSENKLLFQNTRRDYKSLHNRGFTSQHSKRVPSNQLSSLGNVNNEIRRVRNFKDGRNSNLNQHGKVFHKDRDEESKDFRFRKSSDCSSSSTKQRQISEEQNDRWKRNNCSLKTNKETKPYHKKKENEKKNVVLQAKAHEKANGVLEGRNYLTRNNIIVSSSITRHGKIYITPHSMFEQIDEDYSCLKRKPQLNRRTTNSESESNRCDSSDSEDEQSKMEYLTRSKRKADCRKTRNSVYSNPFTYKQFYSKLEQNMSRKGLMNDCLKSESEDDRSPRRKMIRESSSFDLATKQIKEERQIVNKKMNPNEDKHCASDSASESENNANDYLTRSRLNAISRKTRATTYPKTIDEIPFHTKGRVQQKRKFFKNEISKDGSQSSSSESESSSDSDAGPLTREYATRSKHNSNRRKTRSAYKEKKDEDIYPSELDENIDTDDTDEEEERSRNYTESSSSESNYDDEPVNEYLTRGKLKADSRKTRNSSYSLNRLNDNDVYKRRRTQSLTSKESIVDSSESDSDSSHTEQAPERPVIQYITRNKRKAELRKTRNGVLFNTIDDDDELNLSFEHVEKHPFTSSKNKTSNDSKNKATKTRLKYSPHLLKPYIKIRRFDWNKLEDFDWVKFSSIFKSRGEIDFSKLGTESFSKNRSISDKNHNDLKTESYNYLLKRIQNTSLFCSEPPLPQTRFRYLTKENVSEQLQPIRKSPSILASDKNSRIIKRLQNTPEFCNSTTSYRSLSERRSDARQNRNNLRNSRSNTHARNSFLHQLRTEKNENCSKKAQKDVNNKHLEDSLGTLRRSKSETEVSHIDKMIKEKTEFFAGLNLVRTNENQAMSSTSANQSADKRPESNKWRKPTTRSSSRDKDLLKNSKGTKKKINVSEDTPISIGYRKYRFPMKRKRLFKWDDEDDEENNLSKRNCRENDSVTKPIAKITPNNAIISNTQNCSLRNKTNSPIPSKSKLNAVQSTDMNKSKRLNWTLFKNKGQSNLVKPIAHVSPSLRNKEKFETNDMRSERQCTASDGNRKLYQWRTNGFTEKYSYVTRSSQRLGNKMNSEDAIPKKEGSIRRNNYLLRQGGYSMRIKQKNIAGLEGNKLVSRSNVEIPYFTRNRSNKIRDDSPQSSTYNRNMFKNDTSNDLHKKAPSNSNKSGPFTRRNAAHQYDLCNISQKEPSKDSSSRAEPHHYNIGKNDLTTKNKFSYKEESQTSTIWTTYNKDRKRKLKEKIESEGETSMNTTNTKIPQSVRWKASSHVSMIKQTLNDYGGKLTFNDMQDYVKSINKTSTSQMLLHAVQLSLNKKQVFCHQDEVVTKDAMKIIEEKREEEKEELDEKEKKEKKNGKNSSVINHRYSYRILKRELLKL